MLQGSALGRAQGNFHIHRKIVCTGNNQGAVKNRLTAVAVVNPVDIFVSLVKSFQIDFRFTGLPKTPNYETIDVDEDNKIIGLF